MAINSIICASIPALYRPRHHDQAPVQAAAADPWSSFFSLRQNQQSGEALLQAWLGLLSDNSTHFPSRSEIDRNQTYQAGDKQIQVDAQGTVRVQQEGHLQGLLTAYSQSSPCGRSAGAAFVGTATQAQQVKFENGNISLPNGKKIPFGNRGAIVVMADGSQVAVGRLSENSSEQVRTAYADRGEKIPTSPPGMTNVFHLNQAGDVVSQEVV